MTLSSDEQREAYGIAMTNVIESVQEMAENGWTVKSLAYTVQWAQIAAVLKPVTTVDVLR